MALITLTNEDLTEGIVEGNGTFDVLMRAAKAHIEQEFQKNRIRGPDYANVYLGAMTAVMQQSVTYLLGRQQADLIEAQIDKIRAEIELINAQKDKAAEEIALLQQKVLTEQAQTQDQIGDPAYPVEGVIKKQKDLYQAQADGFLRDAEQKLTRLMIDTWSVRRSTDEGTTVSANGLNDEEINKVLNKAKEGIGVSEFFVPLTAAYTYSESGLNVNFEDESLNGGNTITNWNWDFGDTNTSTQKDPSHTFGSAGTYSVRLTVTDNLGNTDSVTKQINVE